MNVPPVSFETTLTLPGNVSKLIFSCYLIKKKSSEVIEQRTIISANNKKPEISRNVKQKPAHCLR